MTELSPQKKKEERRESGGGPGKFPSIREKAPARPETKLKEKKEGETAPANVGALVLSLGSGPRVRWGEGIDFVKAEEKKKSPHDHCESGEGWGASSSPRV